MENIEVACNLYLPPCPQILPLQTNLTMWAIEISRRMNLFGRLVEIRNKLNNFLNLFLAK
jgi:hypothetical protein